MMALSLITIPATGLTAPIAPPGVAPASGVFDLLLPIADPADPRHEPAPDGKQIGKDVPVDEAETPNPLAWLTPPVAPQVSPTAPPLSQAPVSPAQAPVPAAKTPVPAAETPIATGPGKRPVSRPVQTAASESKPALAITSSPAPLPTAQPVTPDAIDETLVVRPLTRAVSPQLPTVSADLPITLTPDTPPRAILTEAPAAIRSITREVSRPLPTVAGEASIAPTAVTPAGTLVQVGTTPVPVIAVTVTTPPPVAAAPAIATPTFVTTAPQPPTSSDATSPRDIRDLPRPVSRQEPSVALETRPAPLAPTPRIAPAALVFADAIHRAVRDDRSPATPDAAALTVLSDIKAHAVVATADAQHGALDLRQEQWPARMIERIDALRAAANANDTSIRLIPDALGKIDVSLKRDGDAVAVHFAAHQPETRQLLADAAPKLAELAEARGLKLAQNGAETAGQQQSRQQPVAQAATTPRRADADDTESTDTRIA